MGGIFGASMFVAPIVRKSSFFIWLPVSLINGYLAYYFLDSIGEDIWWSAIHRAWINMIAVNGLHDKIIV